MSDDFDSFYINLPMGAFSLALILISFKPPPSAKPVSVSRRELFLQLDVPGTACILVALVCVLLVTQWAGVTRPWNSASVVACLVVAGLLTAGFSIIQYQQGERASLVPRILKNRAIVGVSAFAFL